MDLKSCGSEWKKRLKYKNDTPRHPEAVHLTAANDYNDPYLPATQPRLSLDPQNEKCDVVVIVFVIFFDSLFHMPYINKIKIKKQIILLRPGTCTGWVESHEWIYLCKTSSIVNRLVPATAITSLSPEKEGICVKKRSDHHLKKYMYEKMIRESLLAHPVHSASQGVKWLYKRIYFYSQNYTMTSILDF